MTTLGNFQAELRAFGIDSTGRATDVLRESAQMAAEAIVIGNQFGPGAPLDDVADREGVVYIGQCVCAARVRARAGGRVARGSGPRRRTGWRGCRC